MSEQWKCVICGGYNPGNDQQCISCGNSKMASQESKRCPNCGHAILFYSNYCPNCRKFIRPRRFTDEKEYPKSRNANSIKCFAARNYATKVFAQPDIESERLYIIGPGDMLPIASMTKGFYCLQIPGNEKGFVLKSSGIQIDLGMEEVQEPLGYICKDYHISTANILSFQPDGKPEIIGSLKNNDRFPIVKESDDYFRIQLPNGVQGWVHKSDAIRVLSQSSKLAEAGYQSSRGLSDILIGSAGLKALGLLGGLAGDPGGKSVRRAADKSILEKGK